MRKKILLANLITIIHFVWALLIVFSLPLSLMYPWYNFYAMISITLTVASWIFLQGCFLTAWENKLRKKYDPENAYDDSQYLFQGQCIFHYLKKYFRITVPLFLGNVIIGLYLGLTLILNLKRVI